MLLTHYIYIKYTIIKGTTFPFINEQSYLASRTELYLCSSCNETSRFARYNNITKVYIY